MNRFTKAVHAFSVANLEWVVLSNAVTPGLEKCDDILIDILLGVTIWSIGVALVYAVLWLDE